MSILLSHGTRMLAAGKAYSYLRKILERIALLFLFPISYLFMWTYSLIRRRRYHIVEFDAKHLGGWSYSLDGFLRRKNTTESRINYIFVRKNTRISNHYFYALMKRHVHVIENSLVRILLLPLARMQSGFQSKEYGYRIEETDRGMEPFPWFDEQSNAEGKLLLKELGLDSSDAWYVCFFARDNAYNESTSTGYELDYYKTYHASRNADIDNYIAAIKFILANGGHVIRMGSVAKKRISYSHPRLIDYPFSRHRSDFADVYLATHCKFFIGNGSGIVDVSGISDVPLGMVDFELYHAVLARKNMLYMPKLIKFSSSGEYVNIKKYFELFTGLSLSTAVGFNKTMKRNNLIYENNSEEDILMITKAFYQRFVTKSVSDTEWKAWQEGGDCCRPFHDNYCYIWGPFIDKHRCLM